MKEINYTCSLGELCHATEILKRNNYKLSSYPFDWIFSSCDTILDCIKDNFKIFLNKSYYINLSETKCGHLKYHKYMFNHHNPLFNKGYYEYYVRCVDRFRNLLQKQEHKLFIIIFVNLDNLDNIDNLDDLSDNYKNIKNKVIQSIEFNDKFSKYTSNYTLLVIIHIKTKEKNNHLFTYNDNIHFLELYTSPSNGLNFNNPGDDEYLDNILKSKYNFNIKN